MAAFNHGCFQAPDQQRSSALEQVFRVPCWNGFAAPYVWQRLGSRSAR